ncbi:MAG: DUF554 domain-containing protein [Oscillospiraceae bacterium]|nr:DUF554 domain-containing protein [Ruminococcus sp.]MDY3087928.1 DUF554 domain-containing protein [Oscillospiraceae bacterium]HBL99965.1 DUF554 domain-containing protein [Oscillospiraceae bacterium]
MVGLGTIINSAAIIVGGVFGHLFGKILNERIQDSLQKASGICVLFIGIAGAMEGMLKLSGSSLSAGRSMLIVASLALGALVGEILNIEHGFERFGEWLKVKTGNAKDKSFVEGFVTASLTVCIGAMAVVGSIKDGISGDYSILVTKAILDLIIITVMTCSLGKGCAFSAIPVAVFQGLITALARLIKPLMTDGALANLSLIGSILIFCVGVNLVWDKRIKVANLLPSLVFAVAIAFLPFNL